MTLKTLIVTSCVYFFFLSLSTRSSLLYCAAKQLNCAEDLSFFSFFPLENKSIPTGEFNDCVTKQYVYLCVTPLLLYLVEKVVVLVQVTYTSICFFYLINHIYIKILPFDWMRMLVVKSNATDVCEIEDTCSQTIKPKKRQTNQRVKRTLR